AELSMYRDLSFGRYEQVVAAGETEIAQSPSREAAVLPPLCYAYYKLRRYDKMEKCADTIEGWVKAGRNTHSDGMIMSSDLTPFPAMLRSSMQLDFGQYRKAMEVGEAALAQVQGSGMFVGMMAPLRYRLEMMP